MQQQSQILVIFGAESLFPAVFEILGSKRIGATNWLFGGHVTSSLTWPFYSA